MNWRGIEFVVLRLIDEYLERCRELLLPEIERFSEGVQMAFGAANARLRLDSVSVPEPFVTRFRARPCQKLRACWAIRCSTRRTDYGKARHTDQRRAA